jgi:hypothetical protein
MKRWTVTFTVSLLLLVGIVSAQDPVLPDLTAGFGTNIGGSPSLADARYYNVPATSSHRRVTCDDWTTVGESLAGQKIISFTNSTFNVGNGDLRIRNVNTPNGITFMQTYTVKNEDSCSTEEYAITNIPAGQGGRYFPLASMALYEVTDDGGLGDQVVCQVKRACCLVSFGQVCPVDRQGCPALPTSQHNIHAGNRDTYGANFTDQVIPIQDVPSGYYWVEVKANPFGDILESNYDNNAAYFMIFLDQDAPPNSAVQIVYSEPFNCGS